MKDLEQIYFLNQLSFHEWLIHNNDKSDGIWLIFYKKHTKKACIEYSEALDEALCFGWIDSIVKRIDDEKYVRKFTPRKNISNWSDVNKKKVLQLIKQGKMRQEGLNKIDIYIQTGKVDWGITKLEENSNKEIAIPEFIMNEFLKNRNALANFENLPLSHKKRYVGWIEDAKREETKLKRIKEAIELLKDNKKLGVK